MSRKHSDLARKQLERRLAPLRALPIVAPPRGWIKAIRDSLGMTARQLASRMGVAPSRIPVIEKAEITGATTLRTLRQAATAMNCALVYAFVPVEPLDDMVRRQASRLVRERGSRLHHTMQLENQALLQSDRDADRQRSIDAVLSGSLRGLWDDE